MALALSRWDDENEIYCMYNYTSIVGFVPIPKLEQSLLQQF